MALATTDWAAAAAGALAAVAADGAAGAGVRRRVVALGWGLGGAAVIYPLTRTGFADRGAVAGELVAVASYGGAGVLAARRAETDGRLIAAAGWMLHAAFDLWHGHGEHSRLPRWYPALCAGFDVALAVLLVTRPGPVDAGRASRERDRLRCSPGRSRRSPGCG